MSPETSTNVQTQFAQIDSRIPAKLTPATRPTKPTTTIHGFTQPSYATLPKYSANVAANTVLLVAIEVRPDATTVSPTT